MPNSEQQPLVFLSYATPDREQVAIFADALAAMGYEAWIDFREILPGQNWDHEIKRALGRATIIVLFLSKNSIDRRGYLQREIKIALDQKQERLVDDIYLIPILLDDEAIVPSQILDVQFLRASSGNAEEQLARALKHQFDRLGVQAATVQQQSAIRWTTGKIAERREGLPGYEVDIQYLNLASDKYPKISDVGHILRGELLQYLMEQRRAIFEPDAENFNFGQDTYRRTNTLDAGCADPVFKGQVMSIACSIHWYSAGAAHPNQGFKTFSFIVDPVFQIPNPEWMFSNADLALKVVQSEVRKVLLSAHHEEDTGDDWSLDEDWVSGGTSDWSDLASFIALEDGIEFLFAPYSVASYAAGPQAATVPYEMLVEFMKPAVKSALGVEYLSFRKIS